jgi:hypothetical protein
VRCATEVTLRNRRRNLQGRVVAVHNALAAQPLAALEPMVAALGCLNVPVAALEQQLAADSPPIGTLL